MIDWRNIIHRIRRELCFISGRALRRGYGQSRSRPRLLPLRAAKHMRLVFVHTRIFIIYAYTGIWKEWEEKRKEFSWYAKDMCEFPLLLCCVCGLFFEHSLYTGIYDRLPYKDLYTALSMLTHRLNVSLESLSHEQSQERIILDPKLRPERLVCFLSASSVFLHAQHNIVVLKNIVTLRKYCYCC